MGHDSLAVFAKNFVFPLRLFLLPQSALRRKRKEREEKHAKNTKISTRENFLV